MNIKNLFAIAFLAHVHIFTCSAQSMQEATVKSFGDYMAEWCKSSDDTYREKIDALVQGSKACRVNDGIMQLFVSRDETGLLSSGTSFMDSYLNCFTRAIEEDLSYTHSAPVWQKDYTEPVAYNDKTEAPLYFVSMDINTKGAINFSGSDLFFVRDGQITKIVDFKDDNSIAKAIALYSSHKYEEAFRLFRKLAYEDPNNFDAQYYTAVMEIKKQGCSYLNSKVRDLEAAWWITRGVVSNSIQKEWSKERMAKLYMRFDIDETPLPFNTHGKNEYIFSLMVRKLVSNGLMAYKNKKGLYGFMNESGEIVVPCTYSLVRPFDNTGHAVVVKNGKVGYIDKKGNVIVPIKYESGLNEFVDGKTFVILDGNLLIIDDQGNVIKEVGKGYDTVDGIMSEGIVCAHHKVSKLFYIHDFQGNIISVEKENYSTDYKNFCYFKKDESGKRIFEKPISWK